MNAQDMSGIAKLEEALRWLKLGRPYNLEEGYEEGEMVFKGDVEHLAQLYQRRAIIVACERGETQIQEAVRMLASARVHHYAAFVDQAQDMIARGPEGQGYEIVE
jgi:hypothetical protein